MKTYLSDDKGRTIAKACDGDERLKNSYGGFLITMADELIVQGGGRYVVFTEGRVPPTDFDFRIIHLPEGWHDETR
jgi:hypothetical protein